ncbi:MAG: DUF5985 family protein [Pirellulaceae bacterium]
MIYGFLMGVIAMGFVVGGMFFLRFWRESGERLFGLFGVAFLLLAFNRLFSVLLQEHREMSLMPYLIRLLAFAIILAAIVDKNFRRT